MVGAHVAAVHHSSLVLMRAHTQSAYAENPFGVDLETL